MKSFDSLVTKIWWLTILVIGAIAPIFVKKPYVYILSPICMLVLSITVLFFVRKRRSR